MDQRISIVTLGVADLGRARSFYEQLGWRGQEVEETVFYQAGATVTRKPTATFYGGYAGVFLDPDGHAWEIAFNPAFTITDDGAVVLPQF